MIIKSNMNQNIGRLMTDQNLSALNDVVKPLNLPGKNSQIFETSSKEEDPVSQQLNTLDIDLSPTNQSPLKDNLRFQPFRQSGKQEGRKAYGPHLL